VEGGISQALSEAIKRNITRAEEEGVPIFILELNTPGGTIEASTDLADFIFQRENIEVIAYIHTQALSGGTMLALACKEIYIDATIGEMGNVQPISTGGAALPEKIQTVVRERMLSYARERGYSEALVKAMVSPGVEVFLVETADDPRPVYMTGSQYDSLSEEEKEAVVTKKLIVPVGELLTMRGAKAVEYGFARQGVRSTQALLDLLEIERGGTQRLFLTAGEKALAWLDMFSPMLIIGGVVLLFLEIQHPGFGLPGILGLGCFVAFFLVKWTLHYARLFELILFLIGLALLMIEVFIIPGFGLAGVAGIGLIFVSLLLMFQEFGLPSSPRETTAFETNLLKVTGSLAGAMVAIGILLRFLPSMPGLRRMVLQQNMGAANVGEMMERRTPGLAQMVGEVGTAVTTLRPAGRAEFGDHLLDVMTEGEFIEKGTRVQIQQVAGNQVVVREYREV
jgi:membrane-bound serine protease (ClpP class)